MANRKLPPLVVENAIIKYKNFVGAAGNFNAEGNRNFCLMLDTTTALMLLDDGWNIKQLTPTDPEEPIQYYVQVAVKYEMYPPEIWLITRKGKTLLDAETVERLDFADLENVDVVVTASHWTMHKGTKNEKSGIKAYVKTMYATLAEDPFEYKYKELPDSAINTIPTDED